jgi:DNA repair protein RecN (Recombination protein N)
MLLELKVSHFAVIDSLQIHFLRPGLNVLTGETGAGKSVLLKSLSLLMGGKANADVIRTGHDQAVIEGSFDLSERPDLRDELKEMALDSGDDSLVVRRIISQTGKHRLYVNGHLSTLNVVEKIVSSLVEITGQHEHHSLVKPLSQLNVLDEYGSLMDLRQKFQEHFNLAKKIRADIETAQSATKDREQRLDFLKFQINEISSFNPRTGEDQDLQTRFQRARHSSRLHGFAQKAESVLYSQENSVQALVADLAREGEQLAELDPKLKGSVQTLKEVSILVEDAAFAFRDYSKHEQADPAELEKLEERVSDLKKLQKKYGPNVEAILEFKARAQAEYEALEKNEENLKELQQQLRKTEGELVALAEDLHKRRVKAGKALTNGINNELRDLNMKGMEFVLGVERQENLATTGFDEVVFSIKASPKDEPRPISRVASGGELSRLMLAIKQVIAANEYPMTYLFDEVDSGVSGPTAEKVGRKLKSIGRGNQVVCITHLPQVAAFADAHFLISKEVSKGHVKSEVRELSHKDRIQELGRLISGEKITAASLTHAKEMIEQHRTQKSH